MFSKYISKALSACKVLLQYARVSGVSCWLHFKTPHSGVYVLSTLFQSAGL